MTKAQFLPARRELPDIFILFPNESQEHFLALNVTHHVLQLPIK